ncbi:hypothetical protein Ahy_A04g018891 [Arachis hypogaea]|uniref:Uncharacterized protein n=1 Tax=Arachis hypogaea TaxID=3818 RepID=A0A445DEU3_ARAHY|nr:hypothetical protein Ahy_A04g018891 [Arachis hypogaea]
MEQLRAKRKGTCSLSHEDANLESVNELQIPPRTRFKIGQTDCKYLKEEENESSQRDKCDLNLFYVASVVQPNSSQYHRHVINYQFSDPAASDRILGV